MDWSCAITNPWATTSSKEVYRNPWSVVREDHLSGPDGQVGLYGYLDRKDSALVMPLFPDGSTILVRQWRYAFEVATWELPCGALELGEDPEGGARRELAEEAGLAAAQWTRIGGFQPSDARVRAMTHCYVAEGLSEVDATADTSEVDMIRARVPLADCLAAVLDGRIDQVGSAYLILRVAHTRGLSAP
jgi:8-oxo-dGTP pyrophosphatase MutT (NUDIX family)